MAQPSARSRGRGWMMVWARPGPSSVGKDPKSGPGTLPRGRATDQIPAGRKSVPPFVPTRDPDPWPGPRFASPISFVSFISGDVAPSDRAQISSLSPRCGPATPYPQPSGVPSLRVETNSLRIEFVSTFLHSNGRLLEELRRIPKLGILLNARGLLATARRSRWWPGPCLGHQEFPTLLQGPLAPFIRVLRRVTVLQGGACPAAGARSARLIDRRLAGGLCPGHRTGPGPTSLRRARGAINL